MSQNPPNPPAEQPQPQRINLFFFDFGDTHVNQLAIVQSTVWQFDHKAGKVTIYFPFGTTVVLKGKDYEAFRDWREQTFGQAAVQPASAEEVAQLTRAGGGGNSGRGVFKRP